MENEEKQNKFLKNRKNVKIKEPQNPLLIFQELFASQQKPLQKSKTTANLPKLKLKQYIMLNNLITKGKRDQLIESRVECVNSKSANQQNSHSHNNQISQSKRNTDKNQKKNQQKSQSSCNQDFLLTGQQYLSVILKKIRQQLRQAIETLRKCERIIINKSTELRNNMHEICHYTKMRGTIRNTILKQVKDLETSFASHLSNSIININTQQSQLFNQSHLTSCFGHREFSSQSNEAYLIGDRQKDYLGYSDIQQIFKKAGQDYTLEISKVKQKIQFSFRTSVKKDKPLESLYNIDFDKGNI